jgi:uncharacterized protein (UPF0332 family)
MLSKLLADAQQIASLPLPHVAARETYLAVFHAAEAYIFEQTGKVAKTHRGVRSEFARLAKAEPRIGRDLVIFLGTAYQFKMRADYAVGSMAAPISTAAIAATTRFIDAITQLLSGDCPADRAARTAVTSPCRRNGERVPRGAGERRGPSGSISWA